jgi:hypothetical protein
MTRTAKSIHKVLVHFGICKPEEGIRIHRIRPAWFDRAAGAWSWSALRASDGLEVAGSPHSCQEIIKAHRQGWVTVLGGFGNSFIPELIIQKVDPTKGG